MNAAQCKMARAASGLGVKDVAARANVSPDTISRLERGYKISPASLDSIRSAFEAVGIEFIPENGGGAGVRMRK